MDREGYLTVLEGQNEYCNCSGIGDVLQLRRNVESLIESCNFYERNADFDNPGEEDISFLEAFDRRIDEKQEAMRRYWVHITLAIKEGDLYANLHNQQDFSSRSKIDHEDVRKLLDDGEIITIHCSKCNAQIDVGR